VLTGASIMVTHKPEQLETIRRPAAPLIAQIIAEEFDVRYHPGHVRHLLKQLNFSVERPKTRLVQADPKKQNRWIRHTHPNPKTRPARRSGDRF
jgi:transposase